MIAASGAEQAGGGGASSGASSGSAGSGAASGAGQAKKNYGPLYSSPMAIWFTIFFLAPIIIIIIYSFLKKGLYGGVEPQFALDAYRYLGDKIFLGITFRTIVTSFIATVITILIALPCGYFMAKSKNQNILLLLIIIPFWTNFLIRVLRG